MCAHRLWTCMVKPGLGLLHGRKGSAPTSPISRGPARPASWPDAGAPGQTCCGHSGPGTGGQHGLSPFQTVQGPSVVGGVLPRSALPSVLSPSCPQGESPSPLRPGGHQRHRWGAAGHRLQEKPTRRSLAGGPLSGGLLSSSGLCRPTFHEALPVGEAWERGPLPSRARDTASGRADTPCSPRTPTDTEMEVSSCQAGQHDRGMLVTHKVGEPWWGRKGPQHLQDPHPRLGLGDQPQQGVSGQAACLIACWGQGFGFLRQARGRGSQLQRPDARSRGHRCSQVLRRELGVLPTPDLGGPAVRASEP